MFWPNFWLPKMRVNCGSKKPRRADSVPVSAVRNSSRKAVQTRLASWHIAMMLVSPRPRRSSNSCILGPPFRRLGAEVRRFLQRGADGEHALLVERLADHLQAK